MFSSLTKTNGPRTGCVSVTLIGAGFGTENYCPTIDIGGSVSLTTRWTSDTYIIARIQGGRQKGRDLTVSVARQTATMSVWFSYDGPEIT